MEETKHCCSCGAELPALLDISAGGMYVCTAAECALYGAAQLSQEIMNEILTE